MANPEKQTAEMFLPDTEIVPLLKTHIYITAVGLKLFGSSFGNLEEWAPYT